LTFCKINENIYKYILELTVKNSKKDEKIFLLEFDFLRKAIILKSIHKVKGEI